MKTAPSMLSLRRVIFSIACAAACAVNGCQPRPAELPLTPPVTLDAPYPAREVIWAVAPLANESGTSLPDELGVTDALVNTIREVKGLSALPTNRVIQAMRTMGITGVSSPQEARALAQALGADALVVGTITAWNPYHPPQLGMTIAIFARTDKMLINELSRLDPLELRRAMSDAGITVDEFRDLPVAVASRHFDGANHAVLQDVRVYAQGRHDPRTSLGWEYYTQSMARYTDFVCFRIVAELLLQEQQRIARAEADNT